MIAFTILGDQIYDLIPMRFVITACVIAIPVGVVVYLIRRAVKKRKRISEKIDGGQRKKCVSAACFFVPFFACGWAGHAV